MNSQDIYNTIADAQFQKPDENQIEFYLTTIQDLYKQNFEPSVEKPHRLNNFNVIMTITEGKGLHYVDFVPYSYIKGTTFFIAKEQIHNFKVNPSSNGYILAFTDTFLNRLIVNDNLHILNEMFDYNYYSTKMNLDDKSYEDMLRLFKVIEKEFSIEIDEFKEMILQSLLQSALIKLGRERLSQKLPLDKKDKSLYLNFKQLSLKHNYNMQVNDYAKMLEVSSKTLTNLIKKYLGKSTKKYLDEQLILQIKKYLLDGNITVENISDKLYFDEPTNMVKFFKRLENMTPSEFKKQYLV